VADAVSEHFGTGQLVLVAHDASGPADGRIKRLADRTLLARRYGKKRSQA
jgi:hypothetical protein